MTPGRAHRRTKPTRSRSHGRFTFPLLLAVLTLAVVLAAVVTLQHREAEVVSPPPGGVQKATLRPVAAPVGQSKAGKVDLMPFEASFEPAHAGRLVAVQRLGDDGWQTVGTAEQDSRGHAVVMTDQSPGGASYRAVSPPSDGAGAVRSPVVAARPWTQTFSDDFDLGYLDTSKWAYRQLHVTPYGNRLCAQSRKDAVSVSDGELHLRVYELPELPGASRKNCPDGFFANGHISTVNDGTDTSNTAIGGGFAAQYGILSARIQFPSPPGQHGSFWSQPTTGDGTEIDTSEYYGDGRRDGGLSNLVHWHSPAGELMSAGGVVDADRLLPQGREWSSAMHVYSVEWSPSGYVFRVDGHETFRTSKGLSEAPQFLILSLLTSDWELPRLKPPYDQMNVDWVRVWTPPVS